MFSTQTGDIMPQRFVHQNWADVFLAAVQRRQQSEGCHSNTNARSSSFDSGRSHCFHHLSRGHGKNNANESNGDNCWWTVSQPGSRLDREGENTQEQELNVSLFHFKMNKIQLN